MRAGHGVQRLYGSYEAGPHFGLHGIGSLKHGHDTGRCPIGCPLNTSNECIRHGLDHSAAWAGLGQGVQMPQLGNEIIDGPVLCHGLRANLSDNGHVGRDGQNGCKATMFLQAPAPITAASSIPREKRTVRNIHIYIYMYIYRDIHANTCIS